MQNKKIIVVCSKNKAKNDAVNIVMGEYFDDFEIKSLETNSDVSETPIGDDEGIKGCLNRIEDAISQLFFVDGQLYMICLQKNIYMVVVQKLKYQMKL